jgi:hypothetical protein
MIGASFKGDLAARENVPLSSIREGIWLTIFPCCSSLIVSSSRIHSISSTRRRGESLWVKWIIRNLDFFSFLRFFQALTTGTHPVEIGPSRLHIEFDEDEEEKDDGLHAKKSSQVKRLVELHWLQGFPLLGCLTGLTDRTDCKGPFGDYMYSVRQIVALHRVASEVWKWHSVKYPRLCGMMENDESSANTFATMSDAELVEAVIETLCRAMEYHLGYEGNYTRVGRDGTEWDKDVFQFFKHKGTHRKVAYAKEHAMVHIIGQYRRKVDEELRELLGEAYGEWEKLPDDQGIPEGVVL